MCDGHLVEQISEGLSRRELLAAAGGFGLPAVAPLETVSLRHLVDLTHALTPQFPYIPIPGLTFPFEITPIATMESKGVYANQWRLIEHIGTHIDAPSHFFAGGHHLEKTPLRDLIVPIAVIDVRERCTRNHDYGVTIDDIRAYERKHGRLPARAAVFMRSGWDAKVGDHQAFLGQDSSETLHFPGFAKETCEFLVQERDIAGVGVDTVSFDIGPDKAYTAHKALFRGGKWGIENIANLVEIPPAGATAIIGALKVEKASGSPIRLLAAW